MMYTVTSTCATTSSAVATAVLTVNPAPDAGTVTGPDSVCLGESISLSDAVTGGVWTASNGNAFVSSSGSVFGVTAGSEDITYTTSGACGSASADLLVTIYNCSMGISTLPENDFSLYPNPAQNSITITATTTVEKVVINNILGQEIFSNKYNNALVSIIIEKLPAGIYLVRVNDTKVYKLIKQ